MSELIEETAALARKRLGGLPLAWRIGLAVVAGLFVIALLYVVTHSSIDWLNHDKRRADAAEVKAATATDNAVARTVETAGERRSAGRVDIVVHQQVQDAHDLANTIAQARSAPDANQPLPPDRADRLRAADARLCVNVRLSGCAGAAPDHAEVGN